MHRFYLSPEHCRDSTLELSGDEAHHALRVLRLQTGDRVTVLDGAGHEFVCEVRGATKRTVALTGTKQKLIASPALPNHVAASRAQGQGDGLHRPESH